MSKALQKLENLVGEESPERLKEMMTEITFELIQHPEQYWLLERYAHPLREFYRAFNTADR